ncbi:putative inner membrane protein; predicted permease [Candidatus Blochmanniella floridana]|uniref:Putative inner membrane protein predicted permease n=1 Tax=Blochmanniella floridana TaxID=203907 RepID=Q7VQS8_BLOFL|nr:putative inner membrane protein; predicted permease [Candidatus Blochmannia floridanus]
MCMSNILERYIKKYVLLNIFMIFLIFISLSSIIRLVDELRNFQKQTYSVFEIFFCIFLNIIKDFELFLSLSTLLGGVLGLGILELRNELIIMKVFGLSNLQINLSVIKTSIFIVLLYVIYNIWLLPYSQYLLCSHQHYKQYNVYLFPEKNKNLWLMDSGNSFIHVNYMLTTQDLLGINLYHFTEERQLKRIIYIEKATYIDNSWSVSNINELEFVDKMQFLNRKILSYEWNTTLTPAILSMITVNPHFLSISKLICCIKYFDVLGQNSKYYQLIFWDKIFSPIFGVMMLTIALLYSYGPFYKKKISFRLFFGGIIGFVFYVLHQIFEILSIVYNITPIVGSIILIMLFLMINTIFLRNIF